MSKKNFCVLQILIASMLVIALLANTYAWSERGSQSGNELSLNYVSSVNGSTATAQTYWVRDGEEIAVDAGYDFGDVSEDTVLNFVTRVDNSSDGAVPSNVSLFIKVSLADYESAYFRVSVTSPTQEYRDYSLRNGGVGEIIEWVRIVPSNEIKVMDQDDNKIIYEWSIDFELPGTFVIDQVVLENF